jgi:hypothetical protein
MSIMYCIAGLSGRMPPLLRHVSVSRESATTSAQRVIPHTWPASSQ